MKNSLASLKQFAGLFGVCLYSIFFSTSLNASSYSWECKKNRSYLIKEREFIDAKDRLKKFPTEFLSNLDEKSKIISLIYDLETRIATINGNSATVTGFPIANKSFKEIPKQSVIISSYSEERIDSLKTLFEKDVKEIDVEIEGSTITETTKNNFLLNTQINTANFVFTELNEILEEQYKTKKNKLAGTLDIDEFIEISIGKCRLLSEEN